MVRMKLAGSDEGIGSLIKDLEEPYESVELRINIISEPQHAKAKGSEAIQTFRNYIEVYYICWKKNIISIISNTLLCWISLC